MLIMRDEQMKEMGERRFIAETAALIKEVFPEAEEIPPEELQDGISAQLHKAYRYDLETDQHVAAFIISAWIMGPDFDRIHPASTEVLSSQELTADEKIQWLEAWVAEIFSALEGD